MELKGYRLVPLYPHPPPAKPSRSAPRSTRMRAGKQDTKAQGTRQHWHVHDAHTVVVRAGAVGPAVPGGLGRLPAAAGGAGVVQLSAGGGGVVARLRASAMRGEHGDERNECSHLDGDRDGHLSSRSCWVFVGAARGRHIAYIDRQNGATHSVSAFSKHNRSLDSLHPTWVPCYSSCPPVRCAAERCATT